MKKRILAVALTFCVVICLFATTVSAAETTAASGEWQYSVDSGIATITGYTGTSSDITIPKTIDGYVVTAVGDRAFENMTSIHSVTFPSSLQRIGHYAFSGCIGLTSVTLPEKLTNLGYLAFRNCTSLTSIVIDSAKINNFGWHNSYKSYGEPFYNAGIATDGITVEFTENCTYIPNYLFYAEDSGYAPNIKTVMISDSVTTIGESAFRNLPDLDTVYSGGVTTIGKNAFSGCGALSTVNFGHNLTSIAEYAFNNCTGLETVVFPESLTKIGAYAFSECTGLTEVLLPEKLTSLGYFAFRNCTGLNTITVDSVKLNNFGLNNSYGSYGDAFYNAGVSTSGVTVEFTENCTYIPNYLFFAKDSSYAPNIKTVMISDSATTIGESAFRNLPDLDTVHFGGVTTIGKNAFSGCGALSTVNFGHNLTSIAEYAFNNCTGLETVVFPESLTKISAYAFSECTGLTEVLLPEKLTSLGYFAFRNCTGLSAITIDSAKLNNFGLNNSYGSYGDAFYNAGVSTSGVTVEFTENCTYIPNYLFFAKDSSYAPNIKTVMISDSVTTIGESAFRNLFALDTVHIGYGVTTIKKSAFDGCTSLSDVFYNDCVHNWQNVSIQSGNDPLLNAMLTMRACNPFTDVSRKSFYYDPVLWAIENNITNGLTETTFGPATTCNRAQVVTFLWRAAGKPEPTVTEHPFTDVKEGKFYYKAMLWAVEKGITSGTTGTTFEPDGKCTRAQVVTFLYRAMGKPAPTSTTHPFTDVTEGKFYYDAMLWAVEKGITSGMTNTTFAPNSSCTRGQVVTFLYRTYQEG